MYHADGEDEWVFNAYLQDDNGLQPCVLSSFQFCRQPHLSSVQRSLLYSSLVLGIVLHHLGLEYCENAHCTLNNFDSVSEAVTDSSLILCPACLRKLQLCHVLGHGKEDVSLFLRRLHSVLNNESLFRKVCQGDLQKLQEYGVQGEHWKISVGSSRLSCTLEAVVQTNFQKTLKRYKNLNRKSFVRLWV